MAVEHLNLEQAKSREEYKKIKKEQQRGVEVIRPKKKRIRTRLIPIWLRLVLLLVFSVILLMAGAAVGYGAIGGGNAIDVLKVSTWTHIHDLVYKK